MFDDGVKVSGLIGKHGAGQQKSFSYTYMQLGGPFCYPCRNIFMVIAISCHLKIVTSFNEPKIEHILFRVLRMSQSLSSSTMLSEKKKNESIVAVLSNKVCLLPECFGPGQPILPPLLFLHLTKQGDSSLRRRPVVHKQTINRH